MKPFNILVTSLTWVTVSAVWSPFGADKSNVRLLAHEHETADSADLSPSDLLASKTRKSEIYELAVSKLQKLRKESSCHQTAAKVYTSRCQRLQNLEPQGRGTTSSIVGDPIRDFIDGFAASLAICDLETAHAAVPGSCELFREKFLLTTAVSNGVQTPEASHEEIGQCLKGLYSMQNSWTSFNSNRDTAALLCRVSRLDVDKDDLISEVQNILSILREAKLGEEQRRAYLAEEEIAMKTHFQKVRDHFAEVKDGLLSVWTRLSDESVDVANGLIENLKSASGNVEATNLAVKRLLKSMMDGNAEHALAQQNAATASSDLAIVAQSATEAVFDFQQLMVDVGFNVTAMGIALAAMEQRHSEALDKQDLQLRLLVKDVREELKDVEKLTSEVRANAEVTAQWVSKWALDLLPTTLWGVKLPLLMGCPILTIVLVGYGIPPSYTRNIGLAITGILIAKSLTIAGQFQWNIEMGPSALTQLARNKTLSTVIARPVVLQTERSSSEPASPLDILLEDLL